VKVFMDIKIIMFILLFSFYALYWILSFLKSILYNKYIFKFIKYDKRIFRRLYYLFNITWCTVAIYIFRNDIAGLKFFNNNNYNSDLNFVYIIIGFSLFSVVWDFLFISCRNISSFIFKDLKITSEEIEDIKLSDMIDNRNLELLNNVLKAQNKLISGMHEYVIKFMSCKKIDEDLMYRKLINKYRAERKNVKIYVYKNDDEGFKKMQKDFKHDNSKMSGIKYALEVYNHCVPDDIEEDIIYAIVYTRLNGEYIIVLKSDFLYRNEHAVIQNIIHICDLCFELEYNKYIQKRISQYRGI